MAKKRSTKSKKSSKDTIQLDFTNVKEGGGRVRVPEDDYLMRIKSVKQDTSEKSGNPMLVFEYEFVDKKLNKKGTIRDYVVISPDSNQLWKMRDILEALGMKVPKRVVGLQLKKLVGKELGVTLGDEEYDGKMSSKAQDYLTTDDLDESDDDEEDEDDEEDDEDEDDDDDEDDEDDDDDEELDELDLDEL